MLLDRPFPRYNELLFDALFVATIMHNQDLNDFKMVPVYWYWRDEFQEESGNLLHLHGLIGFEQEVGRHKNDGESTTNTNKKSKSGHDNTQKKKMKKKQMWGLTNNTDKVTWEETGWCQVTASEDIDKVLL